jgi:hypothetical protein
MSLIGGTGRLDLGKRRIRGRGARADVCAMRLRGTGLSKLKLRVRTSSKHGLHRVTSGTCDLSTRGLHDSRSRSLVGDYNEPAT